MYESLYEALSPQQVDAYLARLGLVRPQAPTREYLSTLIRTHQSVIPFETLSIAYTGGHLSLATADIYDKLIIRKRGGYCFELNALLSRLLEALGYTMTAHLARAVIRRDYLPPHLHRVNMAWLDGQPHIVDVGFGGPCPADAMPLQPGDFIDSANTTFRLTRAAYVPETATAPVAYPADTTGSSPDWLLERYTPDGMQRILLINQSPVAEVDFYPAHEYSSHAPDSFFVEHRIANMRTPTGSANLTDLHLRIIADGQTTTDRDVSADEVPGLLSSIFGLEP